MKEQDNTSIISKLKQSKMTDDQILEVACEERLIRSARKLQTFLRELNPMHAAVLDTGVAIAITMELKANLNN
jgi:hypothetical protein